MDNAGEYIKSLFHNICCKRKVLVINMNTMNNHVLKKCSHSLIDGVGYIGYSEWQWLFMNENKTQIDLNIFRGLFPKLQNIIIYQLQSITAELLNSIYECLVLDTSNINRVELHITKRKRDSNISNAYVAFKSKFESISFDLRINEQDEVFGTRVLVIVRRGTKY